jgi:hypothetical protein
MDQADEPNGAGDAGSSIDLRKLFMVVRANLWIICLIVGGAGSRAGHHDADDAALHRDVHGADQQPVCPGSG